MRIQRVTAALVLAVAIFFVPTQASAQVTVSSIAVLANENGLTDVTITCSNGAVGYGTMLSPPSNWDLNIVAWQFCNSYN